MLLALRQLGERILVHVARSDLGVASTPEVLVERRRCQSILEHPEARGRLDQAKHFAFHTDFSAETVICRLATEK